MGDPAHRNQIDTGFRYFSHTSRGDPARGFGDRLSIDHRNRFAKGLWIHIVKQHGIDVGSNGMLHLFNCVAFHFNFWK